MIRPAIIAALPREVALLVKGVTPDWALRQSGVYLYQMPSAVVVCAGMGSTRAMVAVRAAVQVARPSMLISIGLAGACSPGLAVGQVLEAGTVVDSTSGERFTTSSEGGVVLVTTQAIAGIREKARLFATYGAALVDMEAATVARMAEIEGVPFRAIKAISDGHDFEMTALGRFTSQHGHFRTGAFALHTALRPHRWQHAMRLGAGSQRALAALTKVVKAL